MNIFVKYLIKVNRGNLNKGFTLIELIIASVMSVLVLGLAGYGLLFALREQSVTSAGGDLQYNLNRAVDFMSEEVKSAHTILTDVSASNLTSLASDFNQTGKNVILAFQVPGLSAPIIYYSSPRPNGSVWLGPNIISRWGPNFSSSGTYTDPTSPSGWSYEPLVDSIDNSSRAVSCPSGWTSPNPASGNTTNGFYVCVGNSGKSLEINAFANAMASLDTIAGTNTSSRYGNKLTYSASTQVYARSAIP